MSSLEASPKFLTHGGTQGPLDDWQLVDTDHSYEGSKYEIDLIGTILDREEAEVEGGLRIRHFIAQPGVCSTSISAALVSWFSNILKVFTFYLVSLAAISDDLRLMITGTGALGWVTSSHNKTVHRSNICGASDLGSLGGDSRFRTGAT